MFKHAAFALSLFLCASAFGADEPQWLKEARAREAKSLKPAEAKSKDGWFKASLPGKTVGAIELDQGSYSVELDIGSDSNVFCEVYPKGVDLANALRQTLGSSMKNIEESQGKVEARALETSDAGAHGAVPYIAMTWLYRVAGTDGPMIGGFKQFVLEKNGHAVYCAHNGLGYTRTFAALNKAFADSLQTQDAASAPHYIEIHTATMSGDKIGIAVTTLERDADGDTKAKEMTAMLVATSKDNIHAQDTTHTEWVRPDGTLINAASVEVVNGDLSTDLGLKQDEGAWIVEGKREGKDFRVTLPKDSQPGNVILHAQEVRALLAEPNPVGREHAISLWIDENPEVLTVAKTKVLSKQGDDRFMALGTMSDMNVNLTLDKATGTPSAAEMKLGPLDMKLERIYVNGSF